MKFYACITIMQVCKICNTCTFIFQINFPKTFEEKSKSFLNTCYGFKASSFILKFAWCVTLGAIQKVCHFPKGEGGLPKDGKM